ncbi:MAG TPA: TonB-dependent receptor [Candidatus Acidoferrales bacterium]|nr:TonB-dependent receptor [Candidatus Acidoferrales bacterium]
MQKSQTWVVILTLVICLAAAIPAHGQTGGGAILGTVTDTSGARVPNAQVAIKNAATNESRTVTASGDGFYNAPSLAPGNYDVTVTAPGFQTLVQKDVDVIVGRDLTLNLELKVGAVSQEVEVKSSVPQVELNNSAITGSVEATTIRELPLNGRDWVQLTLLQSGVSALRGANPVGVPAISPRLESGEGQQISLSGGRPEMLAFFQNGISIMDYANTSPGAATGLNLGVDSIEEFSVIVSTPPASYGRTASGVVNATVRSGSNAFHGSGIAFFRNSALDAKSFFDDNTASIPPFYRHQYGGSIGGPIKKDSTFFFFDYEGFRQSLSGTTTGVSTISADAAQGKVQCQPTDYFSGVCTCTTFDSASGLCSNPTGQGHYWHQVSVAVNPLYLSLVPAGTCPGATAGFAAGGSDTCPLSVVGANVQNEDYYIGRLDHNFGSNDKFDSSYFYDTGNQGTPSASNLNTFVLGDITHRQAFTLAETHVFNSSLVNAWRGGYTRTYATDTHVLSISNPALANTSLGSIPGLDMSAIAAGSLVLGPGQNAQDVTYFNFNTFQMYDDIVSTRGRHTLKFGGGFEYDQDNYDSPNGRSGAWTFTTVEDFLTLNPSRLQAQAPNTSTKRAIRQTIYGIYFQDDIRVRSNFTLNLGLRYERATTPGEAHGLEVGLRNLTDTTPTFGSLYVPSWMGFSPRIGFAWDPFHNGKTSVRAGFGIYDALPLLYEMANRFNRGYPYYQASSVNWCADPVAASPCGAGFQPAPAGTFPGGGINDLALASQNQTVQVQHNPSRSYLTQWNLNIQRDLGHGLAAELGYVGSRGTHLANGDYDENLYVPQMINGAPFWDQSLPKQLSNGGGCPSPTHNPAQALCYYNPALNPDGSPAYVGIYDTQWNGVSFYSGLQAGLSKKMSNGLQWQAKYAWSKSMDTNSLAFSSGGTLTGIANPFPQMPKANYGPSDFNIPQNFIFNGLYVIPTPHWSSGIARALLGGWQPGGIVTLSSGEPFSVLTWFDNTGTGTHQPVGWVLGQKPDLVNTPACRNPEHIVKTLGPQNTATYFDTPGGVPTCFAFPVPGHLGNFGRNRMHTAMVSNVDFSLYKNNYIPRISETFNVQLRFEFFDVFNHASLGFPSLFNMWVLPPFPFPTAGQAGYTANPQQPARQIQMGVKINF